MQLISEKPETEAVVKEKLTGLHKMWEVLESTTQTKAQRLFDANKAELFTQSCADLDKWLHGLETQIQSDDYGKDLTSVNILLKKQQASICDSPSLPVLLLFLIIVLTFVFSTGSCDPTGCSGGMGAFPECYMRGTVLGSFLKAIYGALWRGHLSCIKLTPGSIPIIMGIPYGT